MTFPKASYIIFNKFDSVQKSSASLKLKYCSILCYQSLDTSSSVFIFISDAVIGFRIIREYCKSPVIVNNNIFSDNFRLVAVHGVRAIDVEIS